MRGGRSYAPGMPRPLSAEDLAVLLAGEYGAVPGVVAVALGGSRASGAAEPSSDIDLYVYTSSAVSLDARRRIGATRTPHARVGNTFWEPGDEWADPAGVDVDVVFRTTDWITADLQRVLGRHEAALGYTTCLWFNVLHSVPLHDPTGWFARLQSFADRPYPDDLRRAVVEKNHYILRGSIFSYLHQIEKAVRRGDAVSVNHRVAALLAGYFDILLAVNRQPHPGEKRLVEWTLAHCERVPPRMADDVAAVLQGCTAPPHDDATRAGLSARVATLLDGLDALLDAEGFCG